jgi:hypothetical protein
MFIVMRRLVSPSSVGAALNQLAIGALSCRPMPLLRSLAGWDGLGSIDTYKHVAPNGA